MKFYRNIHSHYANGGQPPSWTWNQLNSFNSAIFERIRIKFDIETKNEVPEQFWPSEPTADKIQDGRHIEIQI